MSAHLPTLLLYTPQRPAWLGKLRGSLTPLGVRLRAVTAEELDTAVGTLAGLTELTAVEDPAGEAPEEVAEMTTAAIKHWTISLPRGAASR